jgi:secreted trypsin-like serine protease
MHKTLLAAACALALAAYAASDASAVDGTPDFAHPNVGALLVQTDTGALRFRSSAFLIGDRYVLAAAHSVTALKNLGFTPDRVFVTFDQDARYPTTVYAVGAYKVHPDFDPHKSQNDVAVITLHEPVAITPVDLPRLGLLDDLNAHNGLKGHLFTNVGYGFDAADSGQPTAEPAGIRRSSQSPFERLDAWHLQLNDNTQATGEGGTCNHDSGSPTLFGDIGEPGANLAVGIVSHVDPPCRAWGLSQRLDIPSIRDFLDDYVAVP